MYCEMELHRTGRLDSHAPHGFRLPCSGSCHSPGVGMRPLPHWGQGGTLRQATLLELPLISGRAQGKAHLHQLRGQAHRFMLTVPGRGNESPTLLKTDLKFF